MESIAIKPKRAQIMTAVIALGALCGVSVAAPALGAAAAVLTPLFACPLVRHREEWLSWTAAAAPALGSLLGGFNALYSVALLLPGMLPLLVTRFVQPKKQAMLWYWGATALGMTAVAAVLTWQLDGPLAYALPQRIVERIGQSEAPGLILYRLASAGLLSVPEVYGGSELLMHLLEPALIRQMLLSLRLTLEMLLSNMLPSVFVQCILLTGLFTALRVQQLNGVMLVVEIDPARPHERKTRVTSPPGFRMLALPKNLRWPISGMGLMSLVLIGSGGVTGTLGLMCYAVFAAVFEVVGAAVIVHVFGNRYPDSITTVGVVAGMVYVFAPLALFLIGITDQAMHYRTRKVHETDES